MKEKEQVNSFLGTLVLTPRLRSALNLNFGKLSFREAKGSTSFLEPAFASTFCYQHRKLDALGYRQLLEAER